MDRIRNISVFNNKILLFVIFFLVFFDTNIFNFDLGFINITLLRILLFSGLIFFLWKEKNDILSFDSRLTRRSIFFLIIWLGYGIIQLLWTKNIMVGIRELYYLSLFISLIILLIKTINSKDLILLAYDFFGFFTVALIIFGIIELITGIHLNTSMYFASHISGKATAVFYNPNDFSFFLNLTFPFLMFNVFNKGTVYSKVFNLTMVGALIVIIIMNDSRLAFITVIIQLILIFVLSKKLLSKINMISGILIALIIFFFRHKLLNGLYGVYIELEKGISSSFIRYNLFLNGLYALYKSKFLGVGPHGYQDHVYPKFYTKHIIDPHNWWIEVLTNYGVFIFVGYLLLIFYIIKFLYKKSYVNNELKKMNIVLLVSWVGFIIGSMGPSSLFYFTFQWFLLGITLAVINYQGKEHDNENDIPFAI